MTEMLGGRYELGPVIGRGGMATVRRARDTRLGRDVAIKQLRPELAGDPTFQARFRREAQSAAGLNHATIVSVYDTGANTDEHGVEIPYIVMELVEGSTLRDILRDGRRILPERAFEIAQGVLDALAYSHKAGIIHRDIKPANVMLTRTGQVKVMDFGIARAVADTSATMTQTAAVIGTAQYLSPEQARGETVDARSDLYSAGCLLYELLTNRPPFVGDSPVSVAYQHVRETPVLPSAVGNGDPHITPAMDAVIMKSLAKRTDDRYQSAREMRDDITRVLAGATPLATIPAAFLPSAEPTVVPPLAGATTSLSSADTQVSPPLPPVGASPAADVAVVEQPTPPRRSTGQKVAIWMMIVGALVALGLGTWAFLTRPTEPKPITITDVRGYNETAATKTLTDQGFHVDPQHVAGKDDDTVGKVTAQDPPGGTAAKRGTTIVIQINDGPTRVTLPDVSGLSREDALKKIDDATLKSRVKVVDSPTTQADHVVRTSPEAGAKIPVGTVVEVEVASAETTVPNVASMSAAEATKKLNDAGLSANTKYETVGTADQVGKVIHSSPEQGQKVTKGSTVTIYIGEQKETPSVTLPPSSPPQDPPQTDDTMVEVPSVRDLPAAAAAKKLRDLGLVVNQVDEPSLAAQKGIALGTNPGESELLEPGATIDLYVGTGVPDTVTTSPSARQTP